MISMRHHQKQVFKKSQQHQKKTNAGILSTKEYKKWLGKLRLDQADIRSHPDHDERNKLAAVKIDHYIDYIKTWLASGAKHQNDVLTQCVVWATDGQRWDILFDLADPAIANPKMGNLHWMKRDLVHFVADTIHKFAHNEQKTGEVKVPVEKVLKRIRDGRWEVNNVLQARYRRTIGIIATEEKDWATAIELFTEADQLYPNIGVKDRLKVAIKELGKKAKK